MSHFKRNAILSFSTFLLTSCAWVSDFDPTVDVPDTGRYTETALPEQTVASATPGGDPQSFVTNADIPAQWWTLFQSEALNALIDQGFANSPNLQAAQATLKQAEQNFRAEVGNVLIPHVDLSAGAAREKESAISAGIPDSNSSIFNVYNASVGVSYTISAGMFSAVEYAEAQYHYQQFEYEAAYITLATNIATTAITKASLDAQVNAVNELIAMQEAQLDIVEKQFQLGAISKSTVMSQETQLAQTRALLPTLEKNQSQTQHALAVLIGKTPDDNHLPSFNLDDLHLPTALPVSLPSTLVRQRPDVRAAEELLHQACAAVGIATGNLFPQFTISAAYGKQNTQWNQLFDPSSIIWNIVGQATQPLFHGGALLAQRSIQVEAYNQIAAQYRLTILTAFQNVADTLRALELDAEALQAYTQAEWAAKETLDLTQKQFELGAVNYVLLLNAQFQYQQALINRIQAQALRYTDTAALFQALGGGWWNRPSEAKLEKKQ